MDKGVSEAVVSIDWTPIIALLSGFGTIILIMLGLIARLLKVDRNQIVERQNKHETWIIKQQEEIHELSEYTKSNVEAIKVILEERKPNKR